MDTLLGIAALLGAIYCLLLILVPALHARRERYWGGQITCLGASLFFGGSGAVYLLWHRVSERDRSWFLLVMFVGFLILGVGKAIDKRAHTEIVAGKDKQIRVRRRRVLLVAVACLGLMILVLAALSFHL